NLWFIAMRTSIQRLRPFQSISRTAKSIMPRALALRVSFLVIVAVLAASTVAADENRTQDEQAIRAAAQEYLAALAKGDAKAGAASWTADGERLDEQGHVPLASKLGAECHPPAESGQLAEAKMTASKIRFLTADVALEDGSSEVVW